MYLNGSSHEISKFRKIDNIYVMRTLKISYLSILPIYLVVSTAFFPTILIHIQISINTMIPQKQCAQNTVPFVVVVHDIVLVLTKTLDNSHYQTLQNSITRESSTC